MIRLQKFLAEAGVASRRAGEQIILEGRVEVNGETVSELGRKIDPLHDKISVDGQALRSKRNIGTVCSRRTISWSPTITNLGA